MKLKHLLIIQIILIPLFVKAQSGLRCPPIDSKGFGKQKVDITAGVGPTFLYGDISSLDDYMGFGVVLKGDYNIYRGLYGGLEFQAGKLEAIGNNDPRYVRNRYLAGTINLTVYPYRFFVTERELFRKNKYHQLLFNGIYVGVGFGGIINRYADIARVPDTDRRAGLFNGPHVINQNGEREWLSSARDMLFPVVNFGIVMPFNKYTTRTSGYFSGVVNTQVNFSMGEDLDGYAPRANNGRRIGQSNDVYNLTYVGLRYTF